MLNLVTETGNRALLNLEAATAIAEREIASFQTHYEILKYMKSLSEGLGMNAFLVLTLPSIDNVELGAVKIITNWPAEMVAYYDEHNLLIDSPVIRRMLGSTSPFNYDVAAINVDRVNTKKTEVIELFNRFNMEKGAYFPVHDASGRRGAVSFSGRRTFSVQEMASLLFISTHVYERLSQLSLAEQNRAVELSRAEIDCLQLVAGGKAGSEIAVLIGSTETAVNNHIASATKKLNCANRTQAVVSALRLKLIRV